MNIDNNTVTNISATEEDKKTLDVNPQQTKKGRWPISKTRAGQFLGKLINKLTPQKPVKTRRISDNNQPMSYLTFRNIGFGTTGAVNLSHKAPESAVKKEKPETTPATIEEILAEVTRTIQTAPEKVPGVRKAASKEGIVVTSTSALLAQKTYTIHADSPDKDVEYRLLKQLDHPNIIKLKDTGISTSRSIDDNEPRTHITLYTESGVTNLKEVSNQALPGKTLARLIADTTAGLRHLHNLGITHNDLKPNNAVLMPDMTTKLIDLGSAIDFRERDCSDLPDNFGTPGYRAPEIEKAIAEKTTTHMDFETLKKADYWAIGCILYELATGIPYQNRQSGVPDNWQEYLDNKLTVIPDHIEGWTTADITLLKQSLRELLNSEPIERNFSSLEQLTRRSAEAGRNNTGRE